MHPGLDLRFQNVYILCGTWVMISVSEHENLVTAFYCVRAIVLHFT